MTPLGQFIADRRVDPILDMQNARREMPGREGIDVVPGMEQRRVDRRLQIQPLHEMAQ